MFEVIKKWKERIFRPKKDGTPEKKVAKVKKAVKKEVKRKVGKKYRKKPSSWKITIGSYSQIFHKYKLLRKRRAKNKMAKKSRRINRRKKK